MILHIPRAKIQPLGDCHINEKWLQNSRYKSHLKHKSRKMKYTVRLVKKIHHVERTCHHQNDQNYKESQMNLTFDLWVLKNCSQLKILRLIGINEELNIQMTEPCDHICAEKWPTCRSCIYDKPSYFLKLARWKSHLHSRYWLQSPW